MNVFATLSAAVFLFAAYLLLRWRDASLASLQSTMVGELQLTLQSTRSQLRRLAEDVFVLRTVLDERNLVSDAELMRGRNRLIEGPRRTSTEREALVRHLGALPNQLVLEEGDDKVH